MNTEMINEQLKLEEESLGMGMTRYREALASRGEANLPPGLKLIKTAMVPLTAAIKQFVAEGLADKAIHATAEPLRNFEADRKRHRVLCRSRLHNIKQTTKTTRGNIP